MRNATVAVLLALSSIPLAHADDTARETHTRRAQTLKVFDSQGKYIGPLVAIDQLTVGTVVNANGVLIVAPIHRVSVNGQTSTSQYEWANTLPATAAPPTLDCRGFPVIGALTGPGVLRPSFTLRSGTEATAYVAPVGYSMPTPPNGQCTGEGSPAPSWLAQSTYPLTQNYPEPLAIHY